MASILLVDDDPVFRFLAGDLFRARGHRTQETSSTLGARQILGSDAFDFALIGATLPDGSGVDLVRVLRAARSTLPVGIIVSRLADIPYPERLKEELSICFFAAKTILPEALYNEVSTHLPAPGSTPKDPFQDLRDEYAQMLPGLMEEARKAYKDALFTRNPEQLKRAQELNHKIRGTAGSLGFREASEQAAAMEEEVQRELADINSPQDSAPLPPDSADSLSQPRQASLVLEGMTLLVVDQDSETHETIAKMGREQLLGVVPARDAPEALESATLYPPNAAMLALDVSTAEATCRLVRDLRKLPGCSALPIAFVAPQDKLELRLAAARSKAELFLTKPVNRESIAALMELLRAQEAPSSKILIVDDDPKMAEALRIMLQQARYKAEILVDPTRLFEVLEVERPEVLLLDARMPKINGFDLCRMIRASVRWKHLLVFFVTASPNLETRLAAFEAGGDDWILKPVLQRELLVRIEARRERLRAMRERAMRDPLTGLLTRTALLEQFSKLADQSRMLSLPFSLALLDVDHFKRVNDEHGHASGDRVLAGLGQILLSRLRQGDSSARWGGEELVVLLEGEGLSNAHLVLKRILREVRTLAFRSDNGERFHVTFSAGLAEFPRDGETLDDLVHAADVQLYKAKSQGRNRIIG